MAKIYELPPRPPEQMKVIAVRIGEICRETANWGFPHTLKATCRDVDADHFVFNVRISCTTYDFHTEGEDKVCMEMAYLRALDRYRQWIHAHYPSHIPTK